MNDNHESDVTKQTPEYQAALIALLEHVLLSYSFIRRSNQPPQYLPMEIPDDLPIKIPLPAGAQLLGSVVSGDIASVYFDSPLNENQLSQFFSSQFIEQGLIAAPDMDTLIGGGGGFATAPGNFGATFCQGETGPYLTINYFAGARQGVSGSVTIHLTGADLALFP